MSHPHRNGNMADAVRRRMDATRRCRTSRRSSARGRGRSAASMRRSALSGKTVGACASAGCATACTRSSTLTATNGKLLPASLPRTATLICRQAVAAACWYRRAPVETGVRSQARCTLKGGCLPATVPESLCHPAGAVESACCVMLSRGARQTKRHPAVFQTTSSSGPAAHASHQSMQGGVRHVETILPRVRQPQQTPCRISGRQVLCMPIGRSESPRQWLWISNQPISRLGSMLRFPCQVQKTAISPRCWQIPCRRCKARGRRSRQSINQQRGPTRRSHAALSRPRRPVLPGVAGTSCLHGRR